MFATLLGPLPRPPLPADADRTAILDAVVRAQVAAGLELVTDGGFGIGGTALERWRTTAAMTDRPVKQVLLGPYSAGLAAASAGSGTPDEATTAAAAVTHADLLALSAAGCRYIEVHEPAVTRIGSDPSERARFREVHRGLLDGVSGPHLSLAVTGGNADEAGIETLLGAPYASLALDLIAGPDNWRLVVAMPGDRGIVCGALSAERDTDDRPEVLVWAAGYATSTGGRGANRVGLASASSFAELPWEVAMRKLGLLGEATRLAALPPDERRLQLDPRAVDSRSAALGRVAPRPPRRSADRPPDQA